MDASETTSWIADTALTPTGWAQDLSIEVTAAGLIGAVAQEASGCATPNQPTQRLSGIVLPALPNVHSHAFQRGLVGRTESLGAASAAGPDPDDFWSWRHAMYAFLKELDADAVEDIATLVYSEMLAAGYGSVAEFHYLHHARGGQRYDDPLEHSRRLLRSAERTGIRLTLVPVVYESSGFGGTPLNDGQRRFAMSAPEAIRAVETLSADTSDSLSTVGIGLHSLRAAPPDALAEVVAWAATHTEVPVHLHIAEQPAEVEACLEWSGARPVQWLLDNAQVDRRWCLVHATHMDERETSRLARTGAVVGLCPTTEANLGDGLFPLPGYEAAGGSWGVGSDSQVSVSPADELRTLEYGQRLTGRTRIVSGRGSSSGHSNGRALLESCLSTGTRVLNQPIGQLAPGMCADLVVLDADHPRLLGLEGDALLDAWILGSAHDAVRDVMVGGRWVVRGRVPQLWDEAIAGYRRTLTRLGFPNRGAP